MQNSKCKNVLAKQQFETDGWLQQLATDGTEYNVFFKFGFDQKSKLKTLSYPHNNGGNMLKT